MARGAHGGCIWTNRTWKPSPIAAHAKPEAEDSDLAADELEIDEEAEENPDDEVDLGGDDDIGVPGAGDDDEEV